MLFVMVLVFQEYEWILDMCCVFGGKISYMVQLMKNMGVIFVNDVNVEWFKSVVGNLYWLGVINIIISYYDGCQFFKVVGGFD